MYRFISIWHKRYTPKISVKSHSVPVLKGMIKVKLRIDMSTMRNKAVPSWYGSVLLLLPPIVIIVII